MKEDFANAVRGKGLIISTTTTTKKNKENWLFQESFSFWLENKKKRFFQAGFVSDPVNENKCVAPISCNIHLTLFLQNLLHFFSLCLSPFPAKMDGTAAKVIKRIRFFFIRQKN